MDEIESGAMSSEWWDNAACVEVLHAAANGRRRWKSRGAASAEVDAAARRPGRRALSRSAWPRSGWVTGVGRDSLTRLDVEGVPTPGSEEWQRGSGDPEQFQGPRHVGLRQEAVERLDHDSAHARQQAARLCVWVQHRGSRSGRLGHYIQRAPLWAAAGDFAKAAAGPGVGELQLAGLTPHEDEHSRICVVASLVVAFSLYCQSAMGGMTPTRHFAPGR